jgi:tRNA-specific 2-thiouridylase
LAWLRASAEEIEELYNCNDQKRGHCIALFSGGLDSALAILLMLRQNIEVTALTFMTHFGCDLGDRSSCGGNPYPAAEKFGFNVKLMHLGQKFVDIVVNPKYGRGKNMNVCTDCRILMLREARELMEMVNADFIITGEVVGQRPMSQTKDKMNLVVKETGLKGRLLRPLSAKLLLPTEPELSGMVDREQLEGIQGRSRKRQIELAAQFGLEDYPTPASGCLLTDIGYSNRLRDLLAHTDRITFDDLNLLKAGRHFRLDNRTKVIVGRNEQDNELILSYKRPSHLHLEALGIGSPITLLVGDSTEENITKAAGITARYTSARNQPQVEVSVMNGDKVQKTMFVAPAREEEILMLALR